jgi:carboxylesterase
MTPIPDAAWPPAGATVIPGAEPWSTDGGPHGALVLHGFTGNCQSMRPVAEALHDAGFAVEMPLLPGHGTQVTDLVAMGWDDWYSAAEAALDRVTRRVDRVVVAGLSMGGSLTCMLAVDHPGLAGIAVINAATRVPPEMRAAVEAVVADGGEFLPAIASDIAKDGVVESAYAETPVAPLLSLFDAAERLGSRLDEITVPTLVLTSRDDHVVPPADSEYLVARVTGPVEHVWLERSYHVATLDHDADEVRTRVVDFARKVADGG